ncbi:MAG: hydrogenase [SAR116 cluster bacterium]|nr:hydrogenase [SAR116 cluster bacterium]HCI20267.1 hydrogenase [Alphaproteobacteria bacterium]|tara:strand:+ start:1273 stop:1905 length:633 start_codon:yes stop_codon:yes gene_type:complete
MNRILLSATAMVLMSAGAAFAHHPLGGMTPQTAMHGFLSGVGHPVIGFDHLAFIIGVGLIAAFHRNKLAMPAAFVAGTVGGTMLTLAAVSLPLAELVITGSVVAAGVVAMRGKIMDLRVAAILAAAAGLFHGWAYGAAVIGAETTPVIAYLVGFGMIQMLIAGGVALATARVWKIIDVAALQPRLAGAVVAGVGLAFLVENVEGMIFSAL